MQSFRNLPWSFSSNIIRGKSSKASYTSLKIKVDTWHQEELYQPWSSRKSIHIL